MAEANVRTSTRPWESVNVGPTNDYNPFHGYDWKSKEWQIYPKSGRIIPVQIERMPHGENNEVALVRGSPRLSYDDVDKIFAASERDNITLMEAAIEVVGQGDESLISPAFKAKMLACSRRIYAEVEGRAGEYGKKKRGRPPKKDAVEEKQPAAGF